MPGRSPSEAIDAFLEPLRTALACVGPGVFRLAPKARKSVGEMTAWALNGGDPMPIGDYRLEAKMHFEVLDRGSSRGGERFKVSTRAYQYGISNAIGTELIGVYRHPYGNSPITFPHFHVCSAALSETGVFLERAHIPSARVSFEYMVRFLIETAEVKPTCDDWDERLVTTEGLFKLHRSWGHMPGLPEDQAP